MHPEAIIEGMSDVTQILENLESGDPSAAEELLPLVYDELRRLAAAKLAREKPGQTLQATALVHDAYLRLVGADAAKHWDNRRHFFAAAAESMRRILVENARHKQRKKRGGANERFELRDFDLVGVPADDRLLDLDTALTQLAAEDSRAFELARLRFFAGLSVEESAASLNVSLRTAKRDWAYARAFLSRTLQAYEGKRD